MTPPRLFIVLLVSAAVANAVDDQRKHPLDAKVDAMVEKANSTADNVRVYSQAYKLWDAELNRCYGELKKRLKPQAFAALQSAQRQWLAYRDEQLKYIVEFYGKFDGTMYIPKSAEASMQVIRQRALELG
jgi:uncharacterized protein YecT (DUF1311 family)